MNRQNSNIKAIVFDFDDTLIDWRGRTANWADFLWGHAGNLHKHLTGLGYNLPPPDQFSHKINTAIRDEWADAKLTWRGAKFTNSLHRCFLACGLPADEIDMEAALRAHGWGITPGVVPFPDTHHLLDELQKRGYQLGLITNSFLPMWMRDAELAHYDLLHYFRHRITSADTGYMKPHPAIYWRMLGMLQTMPQNAIFVGDRLKNDIAGANEVGMISVWMNCIIHDEKVDGVIPDYTIKKLSELLPIIERLKVGDS